MTNQTKPNIILVIIDALRADHLGCYGYHINTSPNLDKLAEQNILFNDAYCCINATDPSLTSIASGMYPRSHGILNHADRIQENEIHTFYKRNVKPLAQILNNNGYTTLAIDFLDRWHKIGFDYYSGEKDSKLQQRFSPFSNMIPEALRPLLRKTASFLRPNDINTASKLTDQSIDLINQNRDNNFFLFIHYWDVHSPYPSTEKVSKYVDHDEGNDIKVEEILNSIGNPNIHEYYVRVAKNSKTSNDIKARYNGSIATVDKEIKKLTDHLKTIGIYDNTFIIITADHGESLTEHEIYFDHHGLYDQTIKVPLIFVYPNGFKENKRISGFVQHIDIFPTILNLLDIDINDIIDGKSLIPLISGEVEQLRSEVFIEEAHTQRKRAIRTNNYKYIYSLDGNPPCRYCKRIHGAPEELYDLNKDPGEINNIADTMPDLAASLKGRILDWADNTDMRATIKNKVMNLKKLNKI